jgi:hypothetical protein
VSASFVVQSLHASGVFVTDLGYLLKFAKTRAEVLSVRERRTELTLQPVVSNKILNSPTSSGDTSVVSPFCIPFPNSFGGNLLYALDHVRWKRSFSATGVGVCRGDVRWQHHGPRSSTGEATKRCNVQSRTQRTNHCYGRIGWVCVAVGRCITLKPLRLQALVAVKP